MQNIVETLSWVGNERGHLVLIDQTRLPAELVDVECRDVEAVWAAIKQLRVRGAPAIGIAAAYGGFSSGWRRLLTISRRAGRQP
jgi:methylthioribose-1-phosphate isomerase